MLGVVVSIALSSLGIIAVNINNYNQAVESAKPQLKTIQERLYALQNNEDNDSVTVNELVNIYNQTYPEISYNVNPATLKDGEISVERTAENGLEITTLKKVPGAFLTKDNNSLITLISNEPGQPDVYDEESSLKK